MNIDQLLKPISEAAPCGEDLSFSAEFDAISELRREDDPTLNQGAWVTKLKTADWPEARNRCGLLLGTRTKDLRLAMWWAEASTLIDGYSGLHQGLDLCRRLGDTYWNDLHPKAEGADMEQRVGNIGWLLSRIGSLSTLVPVARGRAGTYTLRQMQGARSLQATLERSPEKAAQLPAETLTWDKFNRALRETPKEDLRRSLAAIEACLESLTTWDASIDAKLGNDGPSFTAARDALQSAHHELARLARDVGATSAAPAAAPAVASFPSATTETRMTQDATPSAGPLRSREQALAQLRDVAAFFRATEPHSPVAYLAEKAVHWGDMPLHLWLRSVVKDAGSLAHLEELLGLEAPPKDDSAA